ncbi:NAD(P)/FAD-dependent oxidoreductase [Clostridium sp. AL.422]|uniref:NAD(P)/FAD-dependent oxidoreductase n=1 Tax=Clostridium TaxID=1485 RepID=UPI00293DAC3F|nr:MULTISPECIES: NAD(P)/FAD-dependent oxidoreductase [unclassified Clostridium]MDV4151615.1 NAD(P)/FAD-dependent oxidoreductase [Clostridium sp. AL.422]
MKLFNEGRIGTIILRNRIAMAPMGIDYIDDDFGFSEKAINYYVARAEGGTGLIITGATVVSDEFEQPQSSFLLNDENKVGRIKELADKIHSFDSKLCIQLSLGIGKIGYVGENNPKYSKEEIERLLNSFEKAAFLAKKAGVDAIEIHGYGGYLIDQFHSALWNSREDEYGGSFEGRMKIGAELIQRIKKACGEDYPVIYKFTPTHLINGGREIEEGIRMAKYLQNAGASALHVDIGCHACWQNAIPTIYQEPALHEKYIKLIKSEVDIPIIGHGKLGYPEVAERIISDGIADFVALGHYSLADAEWANKVKENREEEIVPCIGCNECMFSILSGNPVSCGVNPLCGREGEKIAEAEIKKSVLIIGAGPGGMQTAITAATRGHIVTIWEKGSSIGGNLIPASSPNFKNDLKRLIKYYENQLNKLKINVVLNKEATEEEILLENPDVLIISTGSEPLIPKINGIEKGNVHLAIDVLVDDSKLGEDIIVVGGGFVGCETAVHLSQRGKKVTIVEMKDSILAEPMASNNLLALSTMLVANKVEIITGSKLTEVSDDKVILTDSNGNVKEVKSDSVVLALGFKSLENLKEKTDLKINDIRVIGDAVSPRRIKHAVAEGFEVAIEI